MKLMRMAGLIQEPELPEAAQETIQEAAEYFLRAGGSLSADEWIELTGDEKAAFVEAGDRIRLEMAASIGMASQSAESAAAMRSPLDNGHSYRQMILERIVDGVAEKERRSMED